MKIYDSIKTVLLLTMLVSVSSSAQPIEALDFDQPCDQAGITIDSLNFDFGRVPQWQDVEQIFFLTNNSAIPVTIKGIATSCACTAAQLPQKTIAPGNSLDITLTLSTKSRFGQTLTNATITFTDPNICPIRLLLEATVFTDGPRFSPSRVHFNQIPFQTNAHESIRIVNLADPQRQWDILSIEPSSDRIEIVFNERLGQVNIALTENLPPGDIEESITITVGQIDQEPYELTLPVTGQVIGPVSSTPNQIFISTIQAEQKLTRKLILNLAEGFRDTQITAFDLPTEIIAIKEVTHTHNLREYQLSIESPPVPGLHKSELIFHTDNPAQPTLTVPILLFSQ